MGKLSVWIITVMAKLGYIGVIALMFLENIVPPIPSELIMPAAGFAASKGELNLIIVIVAGVLGSVLGALPLYYLGVIFDEERLLKLSKKYGKYMLITPSDITQANGWFNKYGNVVVFICRMVPGMRSLISIPAGMNRMPLLPFILLTTLGSAIWTSILAYAGYTFGSNYHKVEQFIAPISKTVVAVIVLAIMWFIATRLLHEFISFSDKGKSKK